MSPSLRLHFSLLPGLLLTACPPAQETTCGDGTRLDAGKCVPSSASITCGSGTRLDAGRCVPSFDVVTCGAGTQLESGVCVPVGGPVTCGSGTQLDAGVCVASGSVTCGGGTHLDAGACFPDPSGLQCGFGTLPMGTQCVPDPSPYPTGCSITSTLVTYSQPSTLPTGLNDTRCTLDAGVCTALSLKGFLYVPPRGKGPFPVLIDNHGSEPNPGDKCVEASYFAQRGFVVFVPHRRGHGKSTGVELVDYFSPAYCTTPTDIGACKMEFLHRQVDDIKAAIDYAKTLPDGASLLVDPAKIAMMGHSFGGIASMFANTQNLGQKAVVNVAGSSQSWEGNPDAVTEMTAAAKAAVAPVLYFEPMNDRSINPTLELPMVAGAACRQFQSALLPAIDTNADQVITLADYNDAGIRDIAHGQTMQQPELWGPMATEFINRYFAKPSTFDNLCLGTSYQ